MDEAEKERIFLELQAEIRAGIEAYERGEGIPLEDVISLLKNNNQLGQSSEAQICPQRRFIGWVGVFYDWFVFRLYRA